MEDEEYHKECDVPNTEILKGLVDKAPTDDVQAIILLYEVGKAGKLIKKDLSASNLKDLVDAGEFFNIPNAKHIKTRSTLAGKVMQANENHLMQKCNECTRYYSIEYGKKPVLSCRKCGQGAHPHCYDDHPVKTGITLIYTCSLCSNATKPEEEIQASQLTSTQLHQQSVPIVNHDDPVNIDADDDDDDDESSEHKHYEITENTCKFFLKTRCKTGLRGRNCKYDHLPVCNKLMRNGVKGPYGCKKGKDCQYYHPHMCRESLNSKTCSRPYCKYYHVNGTVKSENDVNQQYEESTPYHHATPAQPPRENSDNFLGAIKQLQEQMMSIQNQLAAQAQERLQRPPAPQVQQRTSVQPQPPQPHIVYQYHTPPAQKQIPQQIQFNPTHPTYNQLYPSLPNV